MANDSGLWKIIVYPFIIGSLGGALTVIAGKYLWMVFYHAHLVWR